MRKQTLEIKDIFLIFLASAALLASASILLRRLIKTYYEKSTEAYQNKLVKNQIEEVNNVYMTMRGWRHDYHNHMQSLKAYLAMDDISEAKVYLDKLETDLDDINLLFDTGNIGVDAILNSKISLAIHNGIPVDYKATVPKETTVTDIDLCVVIGNLIVEKYDGFINRKNEAGVFVTEIMLPL